MLMNARWMTSLALAGMLTVAAGCGSGGDATTPDSESESAPVSQTNEGGVDAEDGHNHGGWWCGPHGVPESECTRCDSSLIAGFKEKGDWCDEHDVPESQCFKCDPKRAEPFIARYEAKFGKKPPEPLE